MIGLSVVDIKHFMAGMLMGQLFDKFYLRDGEIQTFTEFHLGGFLNRPYFDTEEWEGLNGRAYALWSELRPFAFQIIKGHKLPVRFKFVFQLSDEHTDWLFEHHHLPVKRTDVNGVFINVSYDHQKLICTSGISYRTFLVDKTLEQCWDDMVCQFFKQNHIAYEKIG